VQILSRLEKISGVRAREFTEKLFASGSVLTSKPAPQAIASDCKEYNELGYTFSVAQIEEIGFEQFRKRQEEVRRALEDYRRDHNYFFSALLVTDVVEQSSLLLLAGAKSLQDQIDYPEPEPGLYELAGVVSRKKQLLPYLTHCLEKMK
jgi:manganese-dependent inorganic pyrophosphatase